MDPKAREGVVLPYNQTLPRAILVFRIATPFRVIPESLNIGPVEYFELLDSGKIVSDEDDLEFWKSSSAGLPRRYRPSSQRKDQIFSLLRKRLDARRGWDDLTATLFVSIGTSL